MFQSARLKLTAWYLVIIMAICLLFSSIIYRAATIELERFERAQRFRIEQRLSDRIEHFTIPLPPNPELIEEAKHRILFMLFSLNLGILVISGVVGYFLAGKTLKPIKDMVDGQNRFIGDASHELRTPLTSLKSAFEVYLMDKKRTAKDADTIITESITEVNKLHLFSDALLKLAQYEKPNEHFEFETVPLKQIIDDAIKKIQPIAKQKNITIEKKVEDIKIQANQYSLSDLLVILLDNAIKYSPIKSTITINSEITDGHVLISIKDHGIGIHEKDILHVFDRFYRADAARSKAQSNGYGLGLSIAKKIVASHKGTIRVESVFKKGSTFIVKLPIHHTKNKV